MQPTHQFFKKVIIITENEIKLYARHESSEEQVERGHVPAGAWQEGEGSDSFGKGFRKKVSHAQDLKMSSPTG